MPLIRKQILAPRCYYTRTGVLGLDTQRLRRFRDTGRAMLRAGLQIPVPEEHQDDAYPMSAAEVKAASVKHNAGWVVDFELAHNGTLYAILDIPDQTTFDRLCKQIKYCSPEIARRIDGDGKDWGECITHVALTPIPIWHSQEPFLEENIVGHNHDGGRLMPSVPTGEAFNWTRMSQALAGGERLRLSLADTVKPGASAGKWELDEPARLAWTAQQSRTGGMKAVGTGEHSGKTLYGNAAKRALTGKPEGGAAAQPTGKTPKATPEKGVAKAAKASPAKPSKKAAPYSPQNPPAAGHIVEYYDGEGGFSGTKAEQLLGKVEAVEVHPLFEGGSRVQVRNRSGSPIWIDAAHVNHRPDAKAAKALTGDVKPSKGTKSAAEAKVKEFEQALDAPKKKTAADDLQATKHSKLPPMPDKPPAKGYTKELHELTMSEAAGVAQAAHLDHYQDLQLSDKAFANARATYSKWLKASGGAKGLIDKVKEAIHVDHARMAKGDTHTKSKQSYASRMLAYRHMLDWAEQDHNATKGKGGSDYEAKTKLPLAERFPVVTTTEGGEKVPDVEGQKKFLINAMNAFASEVSDKDRDKFLEVSKSATRTDDDKKFLRSHLNKVMDELRRGSLQEDKIAAVLDSLSGSGFGTLTPKEFYHLIEQKKQLSHTTLSQAFDLGAFQLAHSAIDTNGSRLSNTEQNMADELENEDTGEEGDNDNLFDDVDETDAEVESDPSMGDDIGSVIAELAKTMAADGIVVEPAEDPKEYLKHLLTAYRTHKATKGASDPGATDMSNEIPQEEVNPAGSNMPSFTMSAAGGGKPAPKQPAKTSAKPGKTPAKNDADGAMATRLSLVESQLAEERGLRAKGLLHNRTNQLKKLVRKGLLSKADATRMHGVLSKKQLSLVQGQDVEVERVLAQIDILNKQTPPHLTHQLSQTDATEVTPPEWADGDAGKPAPLDREVCNRLSGGRYDSYNPPAKN